MSIIEGLPQGIVVHDAAASVVSVTVDSSVYPLEALYGAAYIFIDRCYVLLDRPDATHHRVTLSAKKPNADEAQQRAQVGEFLNELLSCAWRHQITQENRAIIEAITTQALSGSVGAPSLDDLANFDFTEESFEDPLGIAMSWEEKYKKKDPTPDAKSTESSEGKTADEEKSS